jgi:hypothetical protein
MQNGSPPQQKAMFVLWYWEANSVIQMQRRRRQEYGEQAPGRQSIKLWLDQFQETGSVLLTKGAVRPSVDADTVEMVREVFQRIPQMAYLEPNVFFQQDGGPPHWGYTVRGFLNKTFPN